MSSAGTTGEGGQAGKRYRFGDIVVDATAHTLSRDGQLQAVEPKAFAVLLALLQRPGELVGREDMLDRVWGHRHVTPGVLTRAIAQLRHALDDDSQHPRYIVTQHALGYRFVGELQGEPPEERSAALMSVADDDLEQTNVAVADADAFAPGQDAGVGDAPLPGAQPDEPAFLQRLQQTIVRARTLRWWLMAAVVAGVAMGSWSVSRGPVAPMLKPGEASIAILPFTNLSPDSQDDYFAEGLAVEMHDALAGVQGLKVAAQMAPGLAGSLDADPKALGQRLGVATVLDASVRREGARVRINARLSDCATGYTLWSHTYDRQLSDVLVTQSEIARQVVKELMVVLPDGGRALTQRLEPTRSVTAYQAYLKGISELRRAGDGGDMEIATAFFSQALAADRGFARAQAGICRSELSRFEGKQDAEIFENAQAACLRASKMDPELFEVDLALGDLHRIRSNPGKAIEHYMRAHKAPALWPEVYIGMGRVKSMQGKQDIALKYFERAKTLRPGDAAIHRAIGFQHYLDENLAKAIESYRTATTLDPGNAGTWSSLGGLYLASGDTSSANAAFEHSISVEPTATGLANLGALRYASRDFVGAADLFRRATALAPGDFRLWGNLGEALLETAGGAKQARQPFERAAEMAAAYVAIKPDDAQALALLAWYRANLGDAAAARELAVRAEALATAPGEVALRNAQTFATLGDMAAARERLQRARQAGVPQSRIETTPILRGLSDIGSGTAGSAR